MFADLGWGPSFGPEAVGYVLQAGSNARVVGSNNVNELPFDVLTGNELPFFCCSFFNNCV